MRDDIADWLTLLKCPGLGPVAMGHLLARFTTPGAVLRASFSDLIQTESLGPEAARAVRKADMQWAEDQLLACDSHSVDILTLADEAYPEQLKNTFAPPPVLYVKGDISAATLPCVAIVGARKSTSYGRHIARMFGEELARRGVCVVSGLALGIDACAHQGALRGGATIAVMGTGLDHPYPLTNLAVFNEICEKGAVISEFPMGTRADPKHFPRRNQTISGISLGVLVVEAGPESGSLLTAQFAIDQNRDVFAIPGPVTSSNSLGPHDLIREGAVLAQSPDSILQELGLLSDQSVRPHPQQVPALSGIEGEIVACLSSSGTSHVDTIATSVGRPSGEVLTILLGLELSSLVSQLPGKQFALKH